MHTVAGWRHRLSDTVGSSWQQLIVVALVLLVHRFKASLGLGIQALVEFVAIGMHMSGWMPVAVVHFSAMEAWRAKELGKKEEALRVRETDLVLREKSIFARESALGRKIIRQAPPEQSMMSDVEEGAAVPAAPGQAISGVARASAAVAAAWAWVQARATWW